MHRFHISPFNICLEPDMGLFDEDTNPWRRIPAAAMPTLTEEFLEKWRDPDEVIRHFPEVALTFLPFRDSKKGSTLNSREAARGAAKAVLQMHSGLPRYLIVEASAVCQLSCGFCSSHSIAKLRRTPLLRRNDFEQFWRHAEFFTHSIDFSGGEPLLNPDLPAIVGIARKSGAYVTISTNGMLLNAEKTEEILDTGPAAVIVSLDGADKAGYETARPGGDFELLCENLRQFASRARLRGLGRTLLGLRFLATRRNFADRERYWKLGRRLGADYGLLRHFRIPPDADPELRRRLLREEALLGEPESCYSLDADGEMAILKEASGCTRSRHPAYVGSGGELLRCVFFPRSTPIGNVVDAPFAEVWLSDENIRERKRVIDEGLRPECKWCPGVWREDWFLEKWF